MVTGPSRCGEFEFVRYKGREYVRCLTCRGWGELDVDHQCQGNYEQRRGRRIDPGTSRYYSTLVDLRRQDPTVPQFQPQAGEPF